MWQGSDLVVILEVDERGGHSDTNYTPECDLTCVDDMNTSIVTLWGKNGLNHGKVPHLFVIRLNPDDCDRMRVNLDVRINKIAERIKHYITVDLSTIDSPERPFLEFWYYDTKCFGHIEFAKSRPDVVKVCKVV